MEDFHLEDIPLINSINGFSWTTFKRFFDVQLDCWIWQGDHMLDGSPCIRVRKGDRSFGGIVSPSRQGYQLKKGFIPPGKNLRRLCDSPRCVNPKHHALACEAVASGIKVTENHKASGFHRAKLTDEIVKGIRVEYYNGKVTLQQLADWYSISVPAVYNAVHGKTWKHVEMPGYFTVRLFNSSKEHSQSKLDDQIVREIYFLAMNGKKYAEIAKQVNISKTLVQSVMSNKAGKKYRKTDKRIDFPPNLVHLARKYKCRTMKSLAKLMGVSEKDLRENYRVGSNLDPLKVKAIRNVYVDGWPLRKIAKEFSVTKNVVYSVISSQTWEWVK